MKNVGTKKIMAACLTMSMMIGTYSFAVSADDYAPIGVGDTVHLDLDYHEYEVFAFTPDETGYYLVYSFNNEDFDPTVEIYDSLDDLNYGIENHKHDRALYYSDDNYQYNFGAYEQFKTGTTYYVLARGCAYEDASYDMSICRGLYVGATFAVGDYIGFGEELYCVRDNEEGCQEEVDYISSDYDLPMSIDLMAYDSEYNQYEVDVIDCYGCFSEYYDIWVTSDDIGTDVLLSIVSGEGTEDSPFRFEIINTPVDPVDPDTPSSDSGDSYVSPEQRHLMSVQNFVERLYLSALGRTYDVGGRDYWVNKIMNDGATGTQIVLGFIGSPEFVGKNTTDREFVTILYSVFFNRTASEAEITNWTNYLAASNGDRAGVISYFASCPEWINYCQFFGISA